LQRWSRRLRTSAAQASQLFAAKAGRNSRVRQRAPRCAQGLPLRAAQAAPLLALDELTYAHPVLAVSKKRFNCVSVCVSVLCAQCIESADPGRSASNRPPAHRPPAAGTLPGLIGQRVRCTDWRQKKIEGSIETPSVRRSARGRRSGLKLNT